MNGITGIISPPITYDKHYVVFGNKCSINKRKLENENKVLMKYQKNLGPIPRIRGQIPVSDTFRIFLIDLLNTGRINVDKQKTLNDTDIKLFEKMIDIAKVREVLNYQPYTATIQDHINRLELLRGGFVAGNHSPELRDEMIELLELLSSRPVGRISQADALEFIDMLK